MFKVYYTIAALSIFKLSFIKLKKRIIKNIKNLKNTHHKNVTI